MKKILFVMFSLSAILFGLDVYVTNMPIDVSGGGKPIKHIQTDVPNKDKSKLRKAYEKGGKIFRMYYEKRWYKPYKKYMSYKEERSAKSHAESKAFVLLRHEDYKRYGCEEEAVWHDYVYSVDYFTALTRRWESITTMEECWNFSKKK